MGTSWTLCFVCDFLVSSFLEFSTFYDFLSFDNFFSLEFFRSLESDFDLLVGFSPDFPELLLRETRDLLREYFEFCEYLDSLVFERPCDPIEFADFLLLEPVPVWILPPSVDLLFAPWLFVARPPPWLPTGWKPVALCTCLCLSICCYMPS
jgi:hypothetical protein